MARNNENYQEDFEDTYEVVDKEESESGKYETNLYLNRSTYDYSLYGTYYSNLLFLNYYDFYAHSCEKNTDTYYRISDPINFQHFWDKWYFWIPLALLMSSNVKNEDEAINYYLGDGLTEQYVRETSFSKYYLVGIGEETFFRGVFQSFFQELYTGWGASNNGGWHLGVASAAAVFGMAHQGQGFQASAGAAFLIGLYFGYVYQPSWDQYDIVTASALHSWWDIIVTYKIFNSSNFEESETPIRNKKFTLLSVNTSF